MPEKRTSVLIANFIDGYAYGWYFAVRDCFRNALDIKWVERKENKTKCYTWIQGGQFGFSKGDIIYDTRLAYELAWKDALSHIKIFVQVHNAMPATSKDIPGFVEFKLYHPNHDRTAVIQTQKMKLSQKGFIDYLRTGNLPKHHYPSKSSSISLFDEVL